MRRAVFLDRDGTVNIEKEYLYRFEEFEFIPGAEEAIRILNEAGYFVVVVSNQSGVARGFYSEEDVESLHRQVADRLTSCGAKVDAWYYCPHHPSGKGSYSLPCNCRKPLPGMLLEAARRFDINLAESVMIGDKRIDVEAAIAAGCRPILVRSGYGMAEQSQIPSGVEIYDDLLSAVAALTGPDVGI